MLPEDDLWLVEDVPSEGPSDLLHIMPELCGRLPDDPHDGDLGLRSILERPEVLSKAWRRTAV